MDELVERVREALAAEYPGAPNGRVRDVPDRRVIRWYTTIGLVDRPLGMRGRTALYGPRHLQQLVAIKRAQADGQSLAQIQADFAWLTPAQLTDASRVPEHLLAAGAADDEDAQVVRHRFWADHPAAAPPPAPNAPLGALPAAPLDALPDALPDAPLDALPLPAAGRPAARRPTARRPAAPAAVTEAAPVHGVALGGGAILLLPHPVTDRDRADIAAAAAPLRTLLESRGLIDGRTS